MKLLFSYCLRRKVATPKVVHKKTAVLAAGWSNYRRNGSARWMDFSGLLSGS